MHLQEVVLGDLIFDRVNEIKITKFHLGWNLDSNSFPTSYHTPNLDTGKASKSFPQNALCGKREERPTWGPSDPRRGCATHADTGF